MIPVLTTYNRIPCIYTTQAHFCVLPHGLFKSAQHSGEATAQLTNHDHDHCTITRTFVHIRLTSVSVVWDHHDNSPKHTASTKLTWTTASTCPTPKSFSRFVATTPWRSSSLRCILSTVQISFLAFKLSPKAFLAQLANPSQERLLTYSFSQHLRRSPALILSISYRRRHHSRSIPLHFVDLSSAQHQAKPKLLFYPRQDFEKPVSSVVKYEAAAPKANTLFLVAINPVTSDIIIWPQIAGTQPHFSNFYISTSIPAAQSPRMTDITASYGLRANIPRRYIRRHSYLRHFFIRLHRLYFHRSDDRL